MSIMIFLLMDLPLCIGPFSLSYLMAHEASLLREIHQGGMKDDLRSLLA